MLSCSSSCCAVTGGSGSSTQNALPLPGSLLTPTVPSISRASSLQIDRPRPVPPTLRVIELSTWLNGRNSIAQRRRRPCRRPVSITSKRSAVAHAALHVEQDAAAWS